MIYVLEGEINKETTIEVVTWMDSNPKGMLYIDSNGGYCQYSELIKAGLERNPKIKIQAIGEVCSAAFDIFVTCNNRKSLGNYFRYGMIHKPDNRVSIIDTQSKHKNPSNIIKNDHKRIVDLDRKYYKRILTKKEYKEYMKGEDVYLNRKRMLEICG